MAIPLTDTFFGLAMGNNSTLTVNSAAPWRKGEYFRKELSVANSSAAVWQSVSVAATGETMVSGNVFVPQTPEAFYYDRDGNLTNDGRWTYTWDAENRLTQVESLSSTPTASKRKVAWEYDGKGRRIRQTTYDGSSGSYVVSEDLKFLSDGWRHIAELNAADNVLVRSYMWGLDLSGTMDGAGGVGGLLMLNSVANGAHFYAYDGNGNTAALIKASDGTVSQICEYDPFGNIIRNTGLMADENRFLFSTKRCDRTTDLELYEYRVRRTDLAWLSRDPIGERGGINVYGFLANAPVSFVDNLGLCGWECGVKSLKFLDRGWTVTATSYKFTFDVVIRFKKDNTRYRPSCCRYVQWIQTTDTLNGKPVGQSAGGTPLDGKLHVDAWPYKGDGDTNPSGGVYSDSDPADDVFRGQDSPGWYGLNAGDVIVDDNVFRGTVIDTCNGNKVVAKKDFKVKASGTWPKLNYVP